ncbi:MAG TPA: ABC transporter permease [Ilumatobacter sp.]|nr:ABC transporter permease [Ilumatobacter sp.]
MAALVWLTTIVVLAVAIPYLGAPDPTIRAGQANQRPFGDWLLGTDQLGRDMFSRLAWGARTSLRFTFVCTVIAASLGVTLGVLAGYLRGKTEALINAVADATLAFPGLVLLLVTSAIYRGSELALTIALAVLLTPSFVRVARANTLAVGQREFVLAARGLGVRQARIMRVEILPMVLRTIAVYALTTAANVFVVEGSLSFLGLGLPPPTPSWGAMIAGAQVQMRDAPHLVVVPALTLVLTVLSLNMLGNMRGKVRQVEGTL